MPFIEKTIATRAWLLACCLGLMCGAGATAQTRGSPCGNPFVNGYGPYDYRSDQGSKLRVVEDNHFTPNVEALVGGNTAPLGGEIA